MYISIYKFELIIFRFLNNVRKERERKKENQNF